MSEQSPRDLRDTKPHIDEDDHLQVNVKTDCPPIMMRSGLRVDVSSAAIPCDGERGLTIRSSQKLELLIGGLPPGSKNADHNVRARTITLYWWLPMGGMWVGWLSSLPADGHRASSSDQIRGTWLRPHLMGITELSIAFP